MSCFLRAKSGTSVRRSRPAMSWFLRAKIRKICSPKPTGYVLVFNPKNLTNGSIFNPKNLTPSLCMLGRNFNPKNLTHRSKFESQQPNTKSQKPSVRTTNVQNDFGPPWIQGSMDPWIHGPMDPWIRGSARPCMDPWVHWPIGP